MPVRAALALLIRGAAGLLAGFAALSGCSSYHEKPLTAEAVEQSLRPPDAETLRRAIARLRGPATRPVELDLDNGCSPDEIAVLAVVINPDLRSERDRRGLSQAQVFQAGLLPNPQLTAGLEQPVGGPDHFTAYNLGLSWDVTSLIGREQRQRAAAADAESVDLDIAWKEWQTAEAAKSAAYDVLALQAQLAQLREIEHQTLANRDLLRRALEHHDKTATDLAGAQTAADDAHEAAVAADGELRRAKQALNRAIGLPWNAAILLRSENLPPQLGPPDLAGLTGTLESRRLDLLALRKGYQSQDSRLRAAILDQFPRINLGITTARDTSNVRTVGLGATIDLPLFDRNQAVIATETATRQKLFDEYVGRVFAARADIAAAAGNIESLNAQIAAANSALPSLENLLRAYTQGERRGDVDALSLYSAQNAVLRKRIDIARLQQQLMQNWVALEIAAGQHLPLGANTTAAGTAASQPATAPGRSEQGS